jgi:Tfp pilus assembly protein PilO
MIIERLSKLEKRTRIVMAVLAVFAIACACYCAITRSTLVKLLQDSQKRSQLASIYASTENQQLHLRLQNLKKQLEDKEEHLEKQNQTTFSTESALQFFENINATALAYNLKPVSKTISEPKKITVNKEKEDDSQQQFLWTQSAKIAVAGNFFDIVDFLKTFTDRPQKVCITNLKTALPTGEKFLPQASFNVVLLLDTSKG